METVLCTLSRWTAVCELGVNPEIPIHEMANQFTISLIWVPGHRDIIGNCIADELARQGTIKPLLLGKENVGKPMATCKLNINKEEYYSRVLRLSDTRYSAKGTKWKWRYASSKARFKCVTYRR